MIAMAALLTNYVVLTVVMMMTCSAPLALAVPTPQGGVVQSFISTSTLGGSGATIESHITGVNGNTGECIFTENDKTYKIKYSETPEGKVTAESEGVSEEEAEKLLTKCRTKVAKISETVEKNMENMNKDMEKRMEDMDKQFKDMGKIMSNFSPFDMIQDKMESAAKQIEKLQEKMAQKQEEVSSHIDNMWDKMESQQEQLYDQQEKIFDKQADIMDKMFESF